MHLVYVKYFKKWLALRKKFIAGSPEISLSSAISLTLSKLLFLQVLDNQSDNPYLELEIRSSDLQDRTYDLEFRVEALEKEHKEIKQKLHLAEAHIEELNRRIGPFKIKIS